MPKCCFYMFYPQDYYDHVVTLDKFQFNFENRLSGLQYKYSVNMSHLKNMELDPQYLLNI